MSQMLDAQARENGTKFLIYPQNKTVPGFENPEVVYINLPPGSIKSGPEDDQMYVVDALNKVPFGEPGSPPFQYRYEGPHSPAVQPNAQGHFDHLRPGERAFSAATMYATVRRALEIWEDYFGREIPWIWSNEVPKLLLIPLVVFNNAVSSPAGYLEFGFPDGDTDIPHCQNFDVLVHELGHQIKYAVIGIPDRPTFEFRGHHEAFGDLVAIVASLHFNTVVDHLLNNTFGDLFSVNELSRVGDLKAGRSIRLAFNNEKFSRLITEPHLLSLPFTGGAFDILVEIFQRNLIERNLISQELGDLSFNSTVGQQHEIREQFKRFYQGKEAEFKDALLDARDKFGKLMATAWSNTDKENLHYGDVLKKILDADRQLFNGKYERTIRSCFDWRLITTDTMLSPLPFETHVVDELVTV
ncbi:hypothetical protein [Paenibacillus sp. S29]|uniref:hypothetical protein n=1 Tax=Paenibacillus sp. S29 TaxID=3394611 RepID=UPI0039BF5C19